MIIIMSIVVLFALHMRRCLTDLMCVSRLFEVAFDINFPVLHCGI